MPSISDDTMRVAVDMAGCPNSCRHCWLGSLPNRRLPAETLPKVAKQFRTWRQPGTMTAAKKLLISSVWREPDFRDDYREMYALEKELSDLPPARYEVLSIWRLARDKSYAQWAGQIGPKTCQITFFGLEQNTDYYIRRPRAFRDSIAATENLLAAGLLPRWQIFLLDPLIPEYEGLVRLAQEMELERRCRENGGEFAIFLNTPSPDGSAFDLEDIRPTAASLEAIPPYLAAKTINHYGVKTLAEAFGQAESEWVGQLVDEQKPLADMPNELWFFVTADMDVYANVGDLSPWWRLGNLERDGVAAVLRCYEDDANPGLQAMFHQPVGELARLYGRTDGQRLYTRGDVVRRWMHLCCA